MEAVLNGREVDMNDEDYGGGVEDEDLIEAMEAEGRIADAMVDSI